MNKNYTKTELAAAMGCSEATINKWMRDGCPHVKKAQGSRRVRPYFDIHAVQSWLETRSAGKGVDA